MKQKHPQTIQRWSANIHEPTIWAVAIDKTTASLQAKVATKDSVLIFGIEIHVPGLSRPRSLALTKSPPRTATEATFSSWNGTAGRKKAAATPTRARKKSTVDFILAVRENFMISDDETEHLLVFFSSYGVKQYPGSLKSTSSPHFDGS